MGLVQLATIYLSLLHTSVGAFVGTGVFAIVLRLCGIGITVTPTACVVTALVALSSPLLAIFGTLMISVCLACGSISAINLRPCVHLSLPVVSVQRHHNPDMMSLPFVLKMLSKHFYPAFHNEQSCSTLYVCSEHSCSTLYVCYAG